MLTEKQKEFKKLIVYQIYPRSFNDSNNDGIGDINGITEKISYLKNLGINAVWLSPCFKSPNKDNGYDIADYKDIMDEFGTISDFKKMLDTFHKNGIKVILDYVANHTSDQHYWFKEARKSKDNPYRDYYYWADKPLNDWKACFGGSAWEYDKQTNQYYLHSYAVAQPDLNWENPKVREEMKGVIDYWVNMGVDGFRCDVIEGISKDFTKPDGITSGPKLHQYIKEIFDRPNLQNIFTVGECWGANEENIYKFCGGDRGELSCCFQFEHILIGKPARFKLIDFNLNDLTKTLFKWQGVMKDKLLYTLLYENHDQPRIMSRFGDKKYPYESGTMLATMLYMMDGIPFIYQGQELGLFNAHYDDISKYDDIETVNYYNRTTGTMDEKQLMESINYDSRDGGRRPFPWNDSKNSGFSDHQPWLPIYTDYKNYNAEKQEKEEKSVLNYYKKLLELRHNDTIINGEFIGVEWEKYCQYKRVKDDREIIVICNYDKEQTIDNDYKEYKILLSNYERNDFDGTLNPYEVFVLEK